MDTVPRCTRYTFKTKIHASYCAKKRMPLQHYVRDGGLSDDLAFLGIVSCVHAHRDAELFGTVWQRHVVERVVVVVAAHLCWHFGRVVAAFLLAATQ